MERFDAGAAVPSDRPRLDGRQARGRGGSGPRGRDPSQKSRGETPPQALYTHRKTFTHTNTHALLTLKINPSQPLFPLINKVKTREHGCNCVGS